jgi:biotin operon repressor
LTAFTLPPPAKIRQYDPLPDQRKIVVMPFAAVFDPRIGSAGIAVLAAVCAYCNRAGITWVSQRRLADDLGITQQAISQQVVKLKKHGYIEVLRKGYSHTRHETIRVIYDPDITAQDAIANVSSREDARPPEQKKEEEEKVYGIINADTLHTKGEHMTRHNKKLSHTSGYNITDITKIIKQDNRHKDITVGEIRAHLQRLQQVYQSEGITPTVQALADGILHLLDQADTSPPEEPVSQCSGSV